MQTIIFILLYPLSIFYGSLLYVRNKFYDWNLFKTTKFNFPIISVGNLALGGTGKTPHTEYLIRLLQEDYKIATLSRGYKRNSSGFYLANTNSTVDEIGDEPLQYKLKFQKINVAVDEKRVHGVEQIKKNAPETYLIILDDAFQHRAISPGMNILITEYNNLYINDTVVPAGRLREWNKGSERADIIIVSKTNPNLSPKEKADIKIKLNPKPHQNVFFSHIKYGEISPFTLAAKEYPSETPNNNSILLLTGIAKPAHLLKFLNHKYSSINHIQFPDHHNYKQNDIDQIIKQFNNIDGNNKFIISTEKDIMRLSLPETLNQIQHIPIFYIPIEVYFNGNDKMEFDNQIIDYVTKNK
jgi:tetraacyldisaccharide 4'-kinase